MAVYFITGKLGAGKSLASVGRIFDYLSRGRPVATNLDIFPYNYYSHFKKELNLIRIPDKPQVQDLESLGSGNTSYDEEKNGLLVLDECGTWFNSRNWNDKSRKDVIDWFLHARKYGWDIIFLVQDVSLVDKQAREALCEHLGVCRRLDRLSIPIIGLFYKIFTGRPLRLPRMHMAKIHYGDNEQALTSDRWLYRGSSFYNAYDTKQVFVEDELAANYCVLPPFFTHGRYEQKQGIKEKLVRCIKIAIYPFYYYLNKYAVRYTAPTRRGGAGVPDKNRKAIYYDTRPDLMIIKSNSQNFG